MMLQHFKVNSSNFQKECFQNLTLTMKQYLCNLSVIVLCFFLIERPVPVEKQGLFMGLLVKTSWYSISEYVVIFKRGGY